MLQQNKEPSAFHPYNVGQETLTSLTAPMRRCEMSVLYPTAKQNQPTQGTTLPHQQLPSANLCDTYDKVPHFLALDLH